MSADLNDEQMARVCDALAAAVRPA
jgi:hypothetical protein